MPVIARERLWVIVGTCLLRSPRVGWGRREGEGVATTCMCGNFVQPIKCGVLVFVMWFRIMRFWMLHVVFQFRRFIHNIMGATTFEA